MLGARVSADLAASWTPNEVADRLRLEVAAPTVERMANSPDAQGRTVSAQAIYQCIHAPRGELATRGSTPPWRWPSNVNTNRHKGTVVPDHQPYLTTIAE